MKKYLVLRTVNLKYNHKDFDIYFLSLKEGVHHFSYTIDHSFFEYFEFNDIINPDIQIDVDLFKRSNLMELKFRFKGNITLVCDISLETYNTSIKSCYDLVIKFGQRATSATEPDVIYLEPSEYKLNIAQLIYESVVLSLPIKKIHPGVHDGSLDSELMAYYETNQQNSYRIPDSRWDKLRLITKNS
ncbi:MAG: DUF177 domain-containing protein [Flavobacteriaceae bacterium]|nr:DUF177 domain-containing protein [Flavobacteriaceae bacterium]